MNHTAGINFINDYAPDADDRVLLKNGRFVDVVRGEYFAPQTTVTVRGGQIAAISGDAAADKVEDADFVIDLEGRTVMPGLINTHCHTTHAFPSLLPGLKGVMQLKRYAQQQIEHNMTMCLACGITTLRDAWCADLRRVTALKERIDSGAIRGPRIRKSVAVAPRGGYLAEKQDPVTRWTRAMMGVPLVDYASPHSGTVAFAVDAAAGEVRDAVDRAVDERGARCIKIGEQRVNMKNFKPDATVMTMDQLTALADQAAKRGLKSTIHHVTVASFRRALEAGISSLAHIPGDALLGEEDVEMFTARGGILEPTLSVPYDTSYRIAGHPTFHDPLLGKLSAFRDRVNDRLVDAFWIQPLQAEARNHHRKASRGRMTLLGFLPMKTLFSHFASYCTTGVRNVVRLFEAGARMSASNDGGVPPCTPATLQHEMELMDLFLNEGSGAAVFSGAHALRMATIDAAICLGLEDSLGAIDIGKRADLVVVDGDPLRNPGVLGSRVIALFMDGKLVIDHCELEVRPSR